MNYWIRGFILLQIIIFTLSSCLSELQEIVKSIGSPLFSSNYSTMLQYSGMRLNDLGCFYSCNKLQEAKYSFTIASVSPFMVQSMCSPEICTTKDYDEFFNQSTLEQIIFVHPLAVKINDISNIQGMKYGQVVFPVDYQKEHYAHYSSGALAMIVFVSLLFALLISSSVVDYYAKSEFKENKLGKILVCFSILENGKKLLTVRMRSPIVRENLEILNFVRVLSIGWVVLGHTTMFGMTVPVLSDYNNALTEFKRSEFLVSLGACNAVDTFFFMSGLLVTYLFLEEIVKTPNLYILKSGLALVHRYLRITPLYMFCLLFFWSLQKYLGSGPTNVYIDELFHGDCPDYWYSNLLYINNFIPNGRGSGCVEVGWYLANDMQFFIVSVFALLLYSRVNRLLGWVFVLISCFIGCLSAGMIAQKYDLNAIVFAVDRFREYLEYFYTKPYVRIAPYALGMAAGFMVYNMKHFRENGKPYDKVAQFFQNSLENKIVRITVFVFGILFINVILFAMNDTYQEPGNSLNFPKWSNKANYIFLGVQRLVYGLGIAFTLIPLLMGHFTSLAKIMELNIWGILAKLNFSIYLIHLPIMEIVWKSQRAALAYSIYGNLQFAIYFFILTSFFALVVVLSVEMPASNLEKLLFAPPRKAEKDETKVIEELKSKKTLIIV
ncbi:hypothetical protein SteCoe_6392 [Stentor coeruleus]|uniref:Acyltransferase 3 domain-containing protein n=1 Tax=Stentor coeruleus TaxID=5963 RepID=A0A1R2CQ43_9CILI|nr:hypothetical protein SteCoe_6392 [Stentor coeruleus]